MRTIAFLDVGKSTPRLFLLAILPSINLSNNSRIGAVMNILTEGLMKNNLLVTGCLLLIMNSLLDLGFQHKAPRNLNFFLVRVISVFFSFSSNPQFSFKKLEIRFLMCRDSLREAIKRMTKSSAYLI